MAPLRDVAPYTTRRRRQLSTSRCAAIFADVVASDCSPEVGYSRGCELQSMHADAGDTLRDALLGAKDEGEEEEQDYETMTREDVRGFSPTCTMPDIARNVSSTEETPSHTHVGERNSTLKEAQEAQLVSARGSLELGATLETMTLVRVPPAAPLGVTTTKVDDPDKGCLQETPSKMASDETYSCQLLPEEFSGQLIQRLTSGKLSTPGKTGGGSILPGITASVSESKALLGVSDDPVKELRTTFVEELARRLSTPVSDEVVFPEGAIVVSEESRAFKRTRYSVLLSTSLPTEGLGETSSGGISTDTTAAQRDALDKNFAEDGGGECTSQDNHSVTTMEKSMCPRAKSEAAALRGESCKSSHHQQARQNPAPTLLGTLSSSNTHVEDSATNTTDEVAPSQGPVTLVQQNATALIKRRRCGSLGLDQSLRWQAMARRVPRIKGVCYSTTRHEWIAVGPLQAGSARKKNIYFSVPKHGFDGARRLAVECRRRLQAGVPVNVQEFVREQQLLFQNEITASQPEEGPAFAPGAVPPMKDTTFVDTEEPLGSVAPGTLSEDARVTSPGLDRVLTSHATDCSPAEDSTISATSRRRRQRPHSLTFAPLPRDLSQRLGQRSNSVKNCPEEEEKHRVVGENIQRDENCSQTGLQKAGWDGYGTRHDTPRAPTAKVHEDTPELKTDALGLKGSVLEECNTHGDISEEPVVVTGPAINGTDHAMRTQAKKANPAHRGDTRTVKPDETIQDAMPSGEPGFSTAPRLAKKSRQTAERTDEPRGAAVLMPTAPLTSEAACTYNTEKSLQLWAAALKYIMQEEEDPNTERVKSRNDSTIASALSAIITRANRENEEACSSRGVPPPFSPAVLQSICDSRTTATSPSVHAESPGHPRRPRGSDKGGLQPQRHASFSAADYYGRRSSTTSSAGSRSSRVSAEGETKDECLGFPHGIKEPSAYSDPTRTASPDKRSLKLWRRESFTEKILLVEKLAQLERVHLGKQRGFGAADRRASVTSAVSRASLDVDSWGETQAAEMCSPKKGQHGSAGMSDLSGTSGIPDVMDEARDHISTNTDGVDTKSDVAGSLTLLLREHADHAVPPMIPHLAMSDTTAIREVYPEKCSFGSLALGDILAFAPADPYPTFSDCGFAPAASASAAQVEGSRNANPTSLSMHREIKQETLNTQELGHPEEACVALDLGGEGPTGRCNARVPASHEKSAVSVVTRDTDDDCRKSGSGEERPTAPQTPATEFLPLMKALRLMLVDLLRFCSWSPVALARAGLEPFQVAFCRTEGRQVLHAALQDVSATRVVTSKFRAYIEVFEDSILANALPTSGGAAEIMYYLRRVKHLTDGKGSPTEQADKEKSAQGLCGRSKCGKRTAAARHTDEWHAGEEATKIQEYSEVLHANCHTHGIRNYQKRNGHFATRVSLGTEEERGSGLTEGGERDLPPSSVLSCWYPTQLGVEEEVEERTRTNEAQFSLGKDSAFASCCVKEHHPCKHAAQLDDEQIVRGSVWFMGRGRRAASAKCYAARGIEDREQRRNAGYPESPKATCGETLSGEDEDDRIYALTKLDGKALPGCPTDTNGCTFQTWRQALLGVLRRAKSFEDLRDNEAIKILTQVCLPAQPAASI